jgi:hypothetical protein
MSRITVQFFVDGVAAAPRLSRGDARAFLEYLDRVSEAAGIACMEISAEVAARESDTPSAAA